MENQLLVYRCYVYSPGQLPKSGYVQYRLLANINGKLFLYCIIEQIPTTHNDKVLNNYKLVHIRLCVYDDERWKAARANLIKTKLRGDGYLTTCEQCFTNGSASYKPSDIQSIINRIYNWLITRVKEYDQTGIDYFFTHDYNFSIELIKEVLPPLAELSGGNWIGHKQAEGYGF